MSYIKRWHVSDGLLSYSGPQGLRRGPELDLSDRTYDGREEVGVLSQGLGQLVDGQKGHDNFRLDIAGHGKGNTPTQRHTHTHTPTYVWFCIRIYIYITSARGTSNNVLFGTDSFHFISALRLHLCDTCVTWWLQRKCRWHNIMLVLGRRVSVWTA